VSVQQWSAYLGELLGVEANVVVEVAPGASIGSVSDAQRRRAITGPCRVDWRTGFRRLAQHFHPGRVRA
jgi:hypothetical protein